MGSYWDVIFLPLVSANWSETARSIATPPLLRQDKESSNILPETIVFGWKKAMKNCSVLSKNTMQWTRLKITHFFIIVIYRNLLSTHQHLKPPKSGWVILEGQPPMPWYMHSYTPLTASAMVFILLLYKSEALKISELSLVWQWVIWGRNLGRTRWTMGKISSTHYWSLHAIIVLLVLPLHESLAHNLLFSYLAATSAFVLASALAFPNAVFLCECWQGYFLELDVIYNSNSYFLESVLLPLIMWESQEKISWTVAAMLPQMVDMCPHSRTPIRDLVQRWVRCPVDG